MSNGSRWKELSWADIATLTKVVQTSNVNSENSQKVCIMNHFFRRSDQQDKLISIPHWPRRTGERIIRWRNAFLCRESPKTDLGNSHFADVPLLICQNAFIFVLCYQWGWNYAYKFSSWFVTHCANFFKPDTAIFRLKFFFYHREIKLIPNMTHVFIGGIEG